MLEINQRKRIFIIKKIFLIAFLLCLMSLIIVMAFLIYTNALEKIDLSIIWYLTYAVSIFFVASKFKNGLFFDPMFILPSAYFFILVVGSLVFYWVEKRSYSFYASNLIGIGYLSLVVGLFLSSIYLSKIVNFKAIKSATYPYPLKNKSIINIFIVISIVASLILFVKSGGSPLLAENRNEAKFGLLAGNGYLYIFVIGLQMLSLAVLYDLSAKNKKLWRSHILAVIVILILFLSGFRSKTMIFGAEYIGLLLFFYSRKLSLTLLIFSIFITTLFLGAMGSFRNRGSLDLLSILNEIGIVVTARPIMVELIIRNFNESQYFWGSRYFADLIKLLPGSQTGANVDLKYEIFPNADKLPDLGGVTPSIVGEAYMNFGPSGILWVMLFIGIFMGLTYSYMKERPSFKACAFYLTLVFGMAGAMQSGIGTKVVHLVLFWFWIFGIGIFCESEVKS